MKPTPLELLAPAKNAGIAIEAIRHGADAVYIGAPAFGARAGAVNTVADIARAVEYAHRFNARVYVTMNTIVYDDEIRRVESLVRELYAAGVDALIVQDMAYLSMDIPPVALHASTQCDIRTPEKARRLADAGFSQLVLPREFSAEDIEAVRRAVDVPLEVFVHGALCVSYSGDCQAGFMAMNRSANRGECPQMCRLPYDLVDGEGNVIVKDKHLLSLKDLCRIDSLETLVQAGATSFKIEGRLKDVAYVKNVVAAYSQALDRIVSASGGRYVRASAGKTEHLFRPSLDSTFNRGYTSYFLAMPRTGGGRRMASVDSPKWTGKPVGKVLSAVSGKISCFRARLTENLSNGDGLGFFNADGRFEGFRLNKVDGDRIYPAAKVDLKPGMTLYRNFDKAFMDVLDDASHDSAVRTVGLRLTLRSASGSEIVLEAEDERGRYVAVAAGCACQEARSSQTEQRKANLSKLGGTIYRLDSLDDRLEGLFVPASVLGALRRDVVAALDDAQKACYSFDRRRQSVLAAGAFADEGPLTYHDNVANRLAYGFYRSHGADIAQKALETGALPAGDVTVMTTRYCIRRELGACLKDVNEGRRLPQPLYLKSRGVCYRLEFDCARCGMRVISVRK